MRVAVEPNMSRRPAKVSLWAIGFARNLRFFAEAFEVGVSFGLCLIGVLAHLRHGWVLTCRLNINNQAHAVSRPNNPPLCKGRSDKNSANEGRSDQEAEHSARGCARH